jgi:hypothetical protein
MLNARLNGGFHAERESASRDVKYYLTYILHLIRFLAEAPVGVTPLRW